MNNDFSCVDKNQTFQPIMEIVIHVHLCLQVSLFSVVKRLSNTKCINEAKYIDKQVPYTRAVLLRRSWMCVRRHAVIFFAYLQVPKYNMFSHTVSAPFFKALPISIKTHQASLRHIYYASHKKNLSTTTCLSLLHTTPCFSLQNTRGWNVFDRGKMF